MPSTCNPNSLVYIAASIASLIAESQSLENVIILSEFFSSIGDNLALIAAQKEALKSELDIEKEIQELKKQLKELGNNSSQ